MSARQYRTEYVLSPLDFPAITGLGESKIDYKTEHPIVVNNKLKLKITKKFVLVEYDNKKEHEILTAVSVYEIPIKNIQDRESIYECFKDAILGLNEAYAYAKKQMPLPNIVFPTPPIATYQNEIDAVFHLLNTLN
jgi:hypothetical protein